MKRSELLARREVLLQRIANQRDDVAKLSDSLSRPLAVINTGYSLVQKIKLHPYILVGSAVLFTVVFRKRINFTSIGLTAVSWLLTPKKLPIRDTTLNQK